MAMTWTEKMQDAKRRMNSLPPQTPEALDRLLLPGDGELSLVARNDRGAVGPRSPEGVRAMAFAQFSLREGEGRLSVAPILWLDKANASQGKQYTIRRWRFERIGTAWQLRAVIS